MSSEVGVFKGRNKLFVGRLSVLTTKETVATFYRRWGIVSDCIIPVDLVSCRSRCFAFVTFEDAQSVQDCLSDLPHVIDGQRVDAKRYEQPKRPAANNNQNGAVAANGDGRFTRGLPSNNQYYQRRFTNSATGIAASAPPKVPQVSANTSFGSFDDDSELDECSRSENLQVMLAGTNPASGNSSATAERTITVNWTKNMSRADVQSTFSKFGLVTNVKTWTAQGRAGMFGKITYNCENAFDGARDALLEGRVVGFTLESSDHKYTKASISSGERVTSVREPVLRGPQLNTSASRANLSASGSSLTVGDREPCSNNSQQASAQPPESKNRLAAVDLDGEANQLNELSRTSLNVYSRRNISKKAISDLFSAFGTVSVRNMSTRRGFAGIFADAHFDSPELTRDALAAIRGGTLSGISLASAIENNDSGRKLSGESAATASATPAAAATASKKITQLLLTVLSNAAVQRHINDGLLKRYTVKCDWSIAKETSSIVVSALLPPTSANKSCAQVAGLIASFVKQQSVTLNPAEQKLCQSSALFAKNVRVWSNFLSQCPGSVEMVLSNNNIIVACLGGEMAAMLRSLREFLDTAPNLGPSNNIAEKPAPTPLFSRSSGKPEGEANRQPPSAKSCGVAAQRAASTDKTPVLSSSESVSSAESAATAMNEMEHLLQMRFPPSKVQPAKPCNSQASQQLSKTDSVFSQSSSQKQAAANPRAPVRQQVTIASSPLQLPDAGFSAQKHNLTVSSSGSSSKLNPVTLRASPTASTSPSTSSLSASSSASSFNAAAASVVATKPTCEWETNEALTTYLTLFAPIFDAEGARQAIDKNLKKCNIQCEWKHTSSPFSVAFSSNCEDATGLATAMFDSFLSVDLAVPNDGKGITPSIAAKFEKKCAEWRSNTRNAFHIALSSDKAKVTIRTHAGNKSVFEIWQNTVRNYLQEQMSQAKTTIAAITLSDTSPELARYGNLQVLAKLISSQFASQALKINVKENGTKLELTGPEENLSCVQLWLGDKANEFSGRPYVISHPLLAHLLNQPSHGDILSQIEGKSGCLIVPARQHIDLSSLEKPLGQTEAKLTNGRVVNIVKINGDLSRQNVDVILKPIFRASDFAALRNHFSHDATTNAVAQASGTLLAEPGLLLCKHVLYALFEDTASSAISHHKADNRFFQKCFVAIRLLGGAKTLALPTEALCKTNFFGGDVNFLQSALVDALSGLPPGIQCSLKEVRLVTSTGHHPTAKPLSAATKEKKAIMPKVEAIPFSADSTQSPSVSISSQPLNPTVLNLANGVKVSLVQDDIAKVNADVLVSSTQEGKRDLAAGGASCKAIFAAGGPDFASQVKACYPDGLPAGADCKATFGRYGSLKCTYVVHVALPGCSPDDARAAKTIKTKAAACLKVAYQYQSIAFPVIGAGGLGYPADVVALGLIAAAEQWALDNGRVFNLKDIRFIIHTSDQTSMQAFQNAFRYHSSSSQISPSSSSVATEPTTATLAALKLGSIKIKLDQAKSDLSKEHLLLASAQNDARFAVEWLEMLVNALIGADKFRIESVVVPLQKGGLEAITPAYLADLFFAACAKYEATSPKHLRTLRPYMENSAALQAFVARMTDLAKLPEKSEPESSLFGFFASLLSKKRPGSLVSTETSVRQLKEVEERLVKFGLNKMNAPCFNVDLTEYSSAQDPGNFIIYGKADDIARAMRILNDILAPRTVDSVQDFRFDRFSKGFTQSLTSANTDFCIASKPGTTTASAFVAYIRDALAELALRFKPGGQLPKDVAWYLQTPDAAWHLFCPTEAATLEYLAKVPSQPKRDARFASFDFGASSVTVGNCSMTMMRKTDRIPIHWISGEEDVGHRMVVVPAHSKEYTDIHAIIQRSNTSQRQVLKIQRIENRSLFQQYLIQKDKISRSCPNGHVVERDLFHGTSKEHLDGICADGFDRSRAGQSGMIWGTTPTVVVGAIFGAGSYFSTTFDYSSSPNYAREGHVLYCKVLVGESVQGSHGLKHLPAKPGFTGVKYESAVNNVVSPSIFVIFADNNAYPAYLITLAT